MVQAIALTQWIKEPYPGWWAEAAKLHSAVPDGLKLIMKFFEKYFSLIPAMRCLLVCMIKSKPDSDLVPDSSFKSLSKL